MTSIRSILTALLLTISLTVSVESWASSASATIGQVVTFSVTADGTQPFTYRWYKGATVIAGATEATYVIQGFASTDVGVYSVIVSNSAGSTKSDNATLSQLVTPPTNVKTSVVSVSKPTS